MTKTVNPVVPLLPEDPGALKLSAEINLAEKKALDSLARYKFAMFGYWAGIWVHLNRIEGKRRPSPFKDFVLLAREKEAN